MTIGRSEVSLAGHILTRPLRSGRVSLRQFSRKELPLVGLNLVRDGFRFVYLQVEATTPRASGTTAAAYFPDIGKFSKKRQPRKSFVPPPGDARIWSTIKRLRFGQNPTLTNNEPHINRLEFDGHSKKAVGFVRAAMYQASRKSFKLRLR